MTTWADTKSSSVDRERWEDALNWYTLTKNYGDYGYRSIGPVTSYLVHWVPIKTKDGNDTAVPVTCPNYNPKTEETDIKGNCPICKNNFEGIGTQKTYISNFIVRKLQAEKPHKVKPEPKGVKFKTKDDETWSPIRVIKIRKTMAEQLSSIKALNKVKDKKTGKILEKDVSDPKYGCDVFMKYNPKADAANMYSAQKGERTPLTEEEKAYLLFDVENAPKPTPVPEIIKLLKRGGFNVSDSGKALDMDIESDSDLEDDPYGLETMSRKELKAFIEQEELDIKVTKKMSDDDIREAISAALDEEEPEEEEEEDEEPPKKSKSKAKSDEDLDEDEESEDDEDEEDDDLDEDDEDLDDETDEDEEAEDDEEEEEPPKKSKSKSKKVEKGKRGKKKPVDDDDDDLDEDDEDIDLDEEEEEEEPPKKSKSKSKKVEKGKRGKKKPVDDDDDDLDEDDDIDFDEDDFDED